MVDVPATRYAHSEQGNIAYQVVGDGPVSVVFVGDWWNHVEWQWEERHHARFLTRLASFSRLILFDKRGTGLSDPVRLAPGVRWRCSLLPRTPSASRASSSSARSR